MDTQSQINVLYNVLFDLLVGKSYETKEWNGDIIITKILDLYVCQHIGTRKNFVIVLCTNKGSEAAAQINNMLFTYGLSDSDCDFVENEKHFAQRVDFYSNARKDFFCSPENFKLQYHVDILPFHERLRTSFKKF